MVRDGCTVVIGGLLQDEQKISRTQIPLLGNLPWVGVAFRNKNENIVRRELIVLITPHIVREPGACREGAEQRCEFERRHAVYAEHLSPDLQAVARPTLHPPGAKRLGGRRPHRGPASGRDGRPVRSPQPRGHRAAQRHLARQALHGSGRSPSRPTDRSPKRPSAIAGRRPATPRPWTARRSPPGCSKASGRTRRRRAAPRPRNGSCAVSLRASGVFAGDRSRNERRTVRPFAPSSRATRGVALAWDNCGPSPGRGFPRPAILDPAGRLQDHRHAVVAGGRRHAAQRSPQAGGGSAVRGASRRRGVPGGPVGVGIGATERCAASRSIALLARNPGHRDARLLLADLRRRGGPTPGRRWSRLQQTLATNPDDPQAHQAMGALMDKLGRPENAWSHYQRAAALARDNAVIPASHERSHRRGKPRQPTRAIRPCSRRIRRRRD